MTSANNFIQGVTSFKNKTTSRSKGCAWVCLLIFFIFFQQSFAQEIPPLTNYPLSIYKAHNQNWAVDQSKDHLIYTANSDGLLEFDGASWKLYPLPDGQIVRTVLCDDTPFHHSGKTGINSSGQRIYTGGYGEFGYWKKNSSGPLKYISLSKNAGFQSLKTEEIWHILKTPAYIYFQSFSRIYRYDGRNIVEIRTSDNLNFMFMRYVNGRLLIQLIGKGLYELKDRQFYPVAGTEVLSATTVTGILPFPQNKILISTTKNGLFLLDSNKITPWNIPLSDELKRNIINKAAVLHKNDSYAFGTIQKGIYVIDPSGRLKYHISKENGLQNNTVLALSQDRMGNLWAALDQGIDMISLTSPLLSYQTAGNPLGSTYAAALWKGQLYVGSNNGVFTKRWLSSEPFRPVPGLEGQTWNLSTVNGELLCGHNDGTYRIEKNGIHQISAINGGWFFLPFVKQKDTLLIQGSYNGLHIYKKDRQGHWSYSYPVTGIAPIPIRQIASDTNGGFWLGHAYKGLFYTRLNANLDSAVVWKEYLPPRDIPSVFSVQVNSWKKAVLIRSASTFFEPDQHGKLVPSKTFMTENEPYKVRAGLGFDWFKIYANRVEIHDRNHIKNTLDISLIKNSETIIPIAGDYYFFCLDDGYALYNRKMDKKNDAPKISPVVRKITNLQNSAEDFIIQNGMELPPRVRAVRISFALPVYGRNIQFQYRLTELSAHWSDWTDQSFVDYTNLQSGQYTFELRSSVNPSVTTYRFGIIPYWYETSYARVAFLMAGGLLLLSLLIYQEKRLKRNKEKLLAEQEEKLRQQQLSSERKIMEIQNDNLQKEIKNKSQQLSNIAINVVKKNEILEEIRDELKQVKEEMGHQLPNIHYQKLLHSIERNVAGKDDWVLFEDNFNEVHEEFFKRLRAISPTISPSELRLAACLRMNLSTKEMSPALGISIRGVEIKRYRLRKKLGLPVDVNLVQYMMDI
ncbi:hypothetical protein DYBT9275_00456 [Dyadobacter sp. CECT 9275]|uniref:HTH luxR-type domain-containing protein n=1 Tax=Dyadobacter helix TaxID=2822344 RepID=A0A916NJM5_9BACT|nr:triple tyrosine motif-containing protein [Dyadobacter sp. CECT 9275]CAG4990121.1 hypothetical protein DYBT9275_00456 [Dyadobacter sp. CECT 9275]